jgi:hypothetical protein
MDWNRVKGFSVLVSHYLKIDLRPFLACHMSTIFLAMRGTRLLLTSKFQNTSIWGKRFKCINLYICYKLLFFTLNKRIIHPYINQFVCIFLQNYCLIVKTPL